MQQRLKLWLHDAICLTDSFIFMLGRVNFKAIRYESTSFNRIVANKWHHGTLLLATITPCDLSDAILSKVAHSCLIVKNNDLARIEKNLPERSCRLKPDFVYLVVQKVRQRCNEGKSGHVM